MLKATFGGYKISISGLQRSTYIPYGELAWPYLPYIDVEVADDTMAISDTFTLAVVLLNSDTNFDACYTRLFRVLCENRDC